MKQPDILIFMSDQHSPEFSGWGNVPVDTPVLDSQKCPNYLPKPQKIVIGKSFGAFFDCYTLFLHMLNRNSRKSIEDGEQGR